jgi:hypothetical protein
MKAAGRQALRKTPVDRIYRARFPTNAVARHGVSVERVELAINDIRCLPHAIRRQCRSGISVNSS